MSELERGKSLVLLTGSPLVLDRSHAIHLRERQPQVLVMQRTWRIRWSRHGIVIGYSHYVSVEPHLSVRRYFAPSSVLLLVAALLGIGTLGLMVSRDSGDGGTYLLSIDIPDSTPVRDLLPPPQARADADKVEVIRPVATLAPPEQEEPGPADAAPADTLPQEPDISAIQPSMPAENFTAEGPAVAAALSSGQFQSWQDAAHARRGFVVVGASERDGDRTCRDLTILVRQDGEGNNIIRQRKCKDGIRGVWG